MSRGNTYLLGAILLLACAFFLTQCGGGGGGGSSGADGDDPVAEGSADAPVAAGDATAGAVAYQGQVDTGQSHYALTVSAGVTYTVSLSGLDDNADLYVYDSDVSGSAVYRDDTLLCSSTGTGSTNESCDATPTGTTLYIVVDGSNSSGGTTFTLGADECDDSDGDGVCDSADACPGSDDTVDTDSDGFADGCDCDAGNADVNPDATELCDGIDNNCDDAIDEGCDCVHDSSRECGSNVGECTTGTQICSGGVWGSCDEDNEPSPETCNGLDDDCDGFTDENLVRACGSNVGECEEGTETCAAGAWGSCVGEVAPTGESCNGLDDDCDSLTDEGLEFLVTCGVGECTTSVPFCADGQVSVCTPGSPVPEVCNSLDDDCDGTPDDGSSEQLCGDPTLTCFFGTCE